MENNIKYKKYNIKEIVNYYILGYKRYEQNTEQDGLKDILQDIVEIAQENINREEIVGANDDLLNKINFEWLLSSNDFISYGTCIFYNLINREIQITAEKIVKEFLIVIHLDHPKQIMQKAESILKKFILNDS